MTSSWKGPIDLLEESVSNVVGQNEHCNYCVSVGCEIGISSGLESHIEFDKTSRKIDEIWLLVHVHMNRSNAKGLGWYFDISVMCHRKICRRNWKYTKALIIYCTFNRHRVAYDSASPAFM